MIVSELITKLQTLPHDARVVVRGYESGVDDVKEIKQCKIKLMPDETGWWDGTYEIAEDGPIDAVYIVEQAPERQFD